MHLYRIAVSILLFSICSDFCTAEVNSEKQTVAVNLQIKKPAPKSKQKKLLVKPTKTADKGWGYLIVKLRKDGVTEKEINSIYFSKRMPPMGEVYFSLNPKESHSMYAGFHKASQIQAAENFLDKYKSIFDRSEKIYKVSRYVIAAIMLVETRFGKNTGKHIVIDRLSRIGAIAKPSNLQAVYKKLHKEDSSVSFQQVEKRGKELEERFYPEIIALIKIGRQQKVNVLNVLGSSAGAFGIPQFLPSTFVNYAVDGNNDGRISLFNTTDAILSVANYLSKLGWSDKADLEKKRAVIWEYNHSEAYIDTVLTIAKQLEENN